MKIPMGLLREFYPKKFDFATITQYELDLCVNLINNRPRKCLDMTKRYFTWSIFYTITPKYTVLNSH